MIRPIPALLLCAVLAAASPAAAQTPDGESDMAARLRQQIERFMDRIADGVERDGVEAAYVIDIREDADGAISAVVRDIFLSGPDFAWEIGDVRLDLVPDGPDRYRATARLPQTTALYDDEGVLRGGTSLGGQRCTGSYVPGIDTWTESDCALTDLVFWGDVPDEGVFRFSVDRTAFRTAFREDRAGKWSGPASVDIEGVRLDVNGKDALGLARLDIDVAYGGWDLVFLAAANEAFLEMRDGFAASRAVGEEEMEEIGVAIADLAMERAPLIEGFSMTVVLTDFHVRDPDLSEQTGFDVVNVGIGMDGLDTDAASFFIEYGHAGLAIPASGPEADFTPHAFDLRLTLDGLPALDTAVLGMDMFRGALRGLDAFETGDDRVRNFAMLALRRALRAESAFAIERLSYESPALRADLAGRFAASGRSPLMAVGTARLEAVGLPGLVGRMEGMAASGDSDARDALRVLAIAQAVGRRVEEGGAVRHVYDLELAEDGRVLLNGNDVGPLLEGLMR